MPKTQKERLNSKNQKWKKQTFERLFSEEALLFAKYLRNEKKEWQPRIATIVKN